MADIDLFAIRSLNGSQEYAFEEFCCQLARRAADVPSGSRFQRLDGAGGDGGVECFWTLPDGCEWGWQAKFLGALDKQQLDVSFRTALRVHPRLTRYTVCFPFNFTGPTGRRGVSQSEKWNVYVAAWEAEARGAGRTVEVEAWGASELHDRLLSVDPTGGRRRYWFETLSFGSDWFERQASYAAAAAGPRYTPELNVQVPISRDFEAFGRTALWCAAWRKRMKDARRQRDSIGSDLDKSTGPERADMVKPAVDAFERAVTALMPLPGTHEFNLPDAQSAVRAAASAMADAVAALRADLDAKHGEGMAENASFRQFQAEYLCAFPTADLDRCKALADFLEEERVFLEGAVARAMTERVLLVIGVAGAGKTHAICDAALARARRGLPSVVVLGEWLDRRDVLEQARERLGLAGTVSRDELLATLDAAGEAVHHPTIIFIDALNEREPRAAWKNDLASLIEQVRPYPHVQLCISCRTTYLDAVLPAGLNLPTVEHAGFAGVEFDACFAFFAHYRLAPPAVPLLQPEYRNPLFLKTVCKGLAGAGDPAPVREPLALTDVVHLLLDGAEQEAAERLDYDARLKHVGAAIAALAAEMAATRSGRVPWRRAHDLVDALLPARPRSHSLLQFLIADGLLGEVPAPSGSGEGDAVRFGFERLGDYLVAERTLRDLARDEVGQACRVGGLYPGGPDGQGLAEAFAILLPERFNVELADLAPPDGRTDALAATLRSLPWRRSDSITDRTEALVVGALRSELCPVALEVATELAGHAGHPLGSTFLDRLFRRIRQRERDRLVCRFLHESWEATGAVRRLSEWATRCELGAVSRPAVADWSRVLAWFCVAADRRVRDAATMGIVALGGRQPSAVAPLLDELLDVEDEYVLERLLLASYGVLVRTRNPDAARDAALVVWHRIFASGPPLNALIRDHARSIVELASILGPLPEPIDLVRCRPPYGAALPSDWAEAPTEEAGEPGEESRAWRRVRASVEGDDFGHYTMESALDKPRRSRLDMAAAKRWLLREVKRAGFDGSAADAYDGYMMYRYGSGRSHPAWAERIGKKYQWIALYRLVGLVADSVPLDPPSAWDTDAPTDRPALQAPGERSLDPTLLVRTAEEERVQTWWAPVGVDFAPALDPDAWLDRRSFPDSAKLVTVQAPDGQQWVALHGYYHWDDRADASEWDEPHRDYFLQLRSYLVDAVHASAVWEWIEGQDFDGRWMPEGGQWLPYVFAGEYPWAVEVEHVFAGYEWGVFYGPRRAPHRMTPTAHDMPLEFEFDSYHDGTIHLLVPHPQFFHGVDLRADGLGGFTDALGTPVFRSPQLAEPGPRALLVDYEWLTAWLDARGLALVWTVLSGKNYHPGSLRSHDLGYTTYSRAHRTAPDGIVAAVGSVRRVQRGDTVPEPPKANRKRRAANRSADQKTRK